METLNHSSESGQTNAASRQVTPEALMRALAAIDGRKAQKAAENGTVALDEALAQMDADLSADEVYAEVLRQRAAVASESPESERRRLAKSRRTLLICALCFMGAIGVISGLSHSRSTPPIITTQAPMPQAPMTYAYDVDAIAHIPNETPFYCISSELQEVFRGIPLGRIQVISNSDDARYAPWVLVKHGGTPYIHGWISATLAPAQIAARNVLIYSHPPGSGDAANLRPISLNCYALQPVGFFTGTPGLSSRGQASTEMLSVAHIRLDKYAWEKW